MRRWSWALMATMLMVSEAAAGGRHCVTGYGRCLKLDPAHPVNAYLTALGVVALVGFFAAFVAHLQIDMDRSPGKISFSALARGMRDPATPAWAKYMLVAGTAAFAISVIAAVVLFNLFGTWV